MKIQVRCTSKYIYVPASSFLGSGHKQSRAAARYLCGQRQFHKLTQGPKQLGKGSGCTVCTVTSSLSPPMTITVSDLNMTIRSMISSRMTTTMPKTSSRKSKSSSVA